MTISSGSSSTFSRPRGPFASFAFPQFRKVWLMSVAFALGHWGERIAVGWVVLVETESVFLTAATFAVRQAPQIVAAPIGGAISDRFSRGKILFIANFYKLGIFALLALIASNGLEPLWLAFLLLALSGIGSSFELPSTQGLVTGSVPRRLRMNAVAVSSTGARAIGAIGALASGFAIDSLGVPATLMGAGIVLAVAGTFALIIDRGKTARKPRKAGTIFGDISAGLRMMWQIPIVRTILLAAVIVEIFGFAFGSVMPSVARDALNVDAKGLGTLTLMQGIGSVIGTIILMALGNFRRKGLLLIAIALFYGIFVATFSASGSYLIALILIVGVGASAASFDAMQWILLQLNVPDDMRGRAIGAWAFAIGFGWIGHLGLGAVGELVGVQWALAGAGIMVFATGIVLFLVAPRLRRA